MELWQMDVMGGVFLADGIEFKAITGIDDHSRYCVIARLVARATARPVCDALLEALSRHGVPEQILTDIQAGWRSPGAWFDWPAGQGSEGPAPAHRR